MFAIYFKVYWWIVILFNGWQEILSEIVKKVSSTLKEEMYRNDSSVNDIKYHWKIAMLIPDISFHKQHSLTKLYFRKHDEMQAIPWLTFFPECAKPTLWPFLYLRASYSVVDWVSKSSWERMQGFCFRLANRENHRLRK